MTPTAEALRERVSELSDKDLVLMVTVDRDSYRENALAAADAELRRRNIPQAAIDEFLGLLDFPLRRAEVRGGACVAMGAPGEDEEQALWEEANRPKEPPKDFERYVRSLTPRAPVPFFTKEAEKNLRERRCVLCAATLGDAPPFYLAGRHRKRRVDGWIKKTRYRYQACYVPICRGCFSRYNNLFSGVTVLLWLGLAFVFFTFVDWKLKGELSPYMCLASILGILAGYAGQRALGGSLLCRRVVAAAEPYPHLGLPCYRKELLRENLHDLKPLPKSIEKAI